MGERAAPTQGPTTELLFPDRKGTQGPCRGFPLRTGNPGEEASCSWDPKTGATNKDGRQTSLCQGLLLAQPSPLPLGHRPPVCPVHLSSLLPQPDPALLADLCLASAHHKPLHLLRPRPGSLLPPHPFIPQTSFPSPKTSGSSSPSSNTAPLLQLCHQPGPAPGPHPECQARPAVVRVYPCGKDEPCLAGACLQPALPLRHLFGSQLVRGSACP